jgi:hypothetical protein
MIPRTTTTTKWNRIVSEVDYYYSSSTTTSSGVRSTAPLWPPPPPPPPLSVMYDGRRQQLSRCPTTRNMHGSSCCSSSSSTHRWLLVILLQTVVVVMGVSNFVTASSSSWSSHRYGLGLLQIRAGSFITTTTTNNNNNMDDAADSTNSHGGGAAADDDDDDDDTPTVTTTSAASSHEFQKDISSVEPSIQTAYRIQQQLYLQSRSLQLRQALIGRGLTELSHGGSTTAAVKAGSGGTGSPTHVPKTVVDWECAQSTVEYPKSCLYSLDAEYGQKVICPMVVEHHDNNNMDKNNNNNNNNNNNAVTAATQHSSKKKQYEWITISALNRLYRIDPNKVESLWYHQYSILNTWFSTRHFYSLYSYMNWYGSIITTALNLQPTWLLSVVILVCGLSTGTLLFFPLLESFITFTVTSSTLWSTWPTWSRFVHAALPLQLLMGQLLMGAVGQLVQMVTTTVRTILIEEECRLLQLCVPLTIVETSQPEEKPPNDTMVDHADDDDDDDIEDKTMLKR